ncbi:hypothetical protein HCN44_000433 [Aphidius gifuensis]|uniref:Uncharacterized protein n=1 Tax=Aphidius gifuensis TaxID=684658 RepID=A0A834XNL7_APHGI|nr:hypothetical protein HCN44_000433 [Aphidius gifuensis]
METLYHQTNKLVQETQSLCTQQYKRGVNYDYDHYDQDAIENDIFNCEKLDIYCIKGPITQRQNAKMRVDQLQYDSRHLTSAFNTWKNQKLRQKQAEDKREALLSQKFTTNDHIDISIMIDHNYQHNNQVRNINQGIDID